VAATLVGLAGAVSVRTGVTGEEESEASPVPAALVAATEKR
jgi:hypothetical protein